MNIYVINPFLISSLLILSSDEYRKKENTSRLVFEALLDHGYEGIDTANQPLHYNEALAGKALQDIENIQNERSIKNPKTYFIQTKFTHASHHGKLSPPYNKRAKVYDQVRQSFLDPENGSINHLFQGRSNKKVDLLILHGPLDSDGDELSSKDIEAWRAMESLAKEGYVRGIGISNINAKQLKHLSSFAEILPSAIQIRCRAGKGQRWFKDLREIAKELDLTIQCFGIISLNRDLLIHKSVQQAVDARNGKYTPQQILFNFVHKSLGAVVLSGPQQSKHMKESYEAIYNFSPPLSENEISNILKIGDELAENDFSDQNVKLTIKNDYENDVIEIFWLGHDGTQKVSNGIVEPGSNTLIDTYHGHLFQIQRGSEILVKGTIDARKGNSQTIKYGNDVKDEL